MNRCPAVLLLAAMLWLPAFAEAAPPALFQSAEAIIIRRCLACHHTGQVSGGLDLTTRAGLLRGGESGAAFNSQVPGESYLLERIHAGQMPPEEKNVSQALSKEEQSTVRQWILAGAPWPDGRELDPYELSTDSRAGRDWWSLQQITRPALSTGPALSTERQPAWCRNPIDRFVLDRLETAEMKPAPEASRRTLIRRLSFDLLGLPPSADEIDAFVSNESPLAYEQLVDRLLASPHFGERWARHWLDLVRYADTCGYERDQEKPGVWRYRDWVASAINDDMPYDQFVTAQLAGDEIPDRNESTVVATGFLRLGTWNDEPNKPHEYKYERLEDMVHATSSAFLAMTVKCARCHDHKFDPIPQVDYYRMASAFWAGYIEPRGSQHLGGPSSEELGFDVFGWTDRSADPPALHLLKSGDAKHPGAVVKFAQLSMANSFNVPDRSATAASSKRATTGRRLQLAAWIVAPANPLTARVIVNRLWQHHFGQGLVRSVNNFGFTGTRPTHPLLLDWLASELVFPSDGVKDDAWRLKRLHKMMVMSAIYRQASQSPHQDDYATRDAGNRLLWRATRRRLDIESIRDSMLTASGQIDLRIGGPSFRPSIAADALEGLSRKEGAWKPSPAQQQRRRSLYIFTQRSLLFPLLTTFDFSDTVLPCGQRDITTVAPQALTLLNSDFVHEQGRAIAERVVEQTADDQDKNIHRVWRLVLGRDPDESEIRLANNHLRQQRSHFAASDKQASGRASPQRLALESLCHVLLNSNELVYVD